MTGEELTASYLEEALFKSEAEKLLTADLKGQLKYLHIAGEDDWDGYLKTRGRFFDRTIAAYL